MAPSAMKTLIEQLRGQKDVGWQPREFVPPPAIQLEAAYELLRLERQVTLHKQFLESQALFAAFAKWADKATRKT
jgi:hypothetical protein